MLDSVIKVYNIKILTTKIELYQRRSQGGRHIFEFSRVLAMLGYTAVVPFSGLAFNAAMSNGKWSI